MAIVISGVNNNDKITAADGTIDLLSSANLTGILTAPAFNASNNITAANINVGNNIQLGNAGIITATTFVGNLTGNVTGNVNATSNLLLQIGGSEKFRVASSGQLGIGGANYGTSGQVLTSGGSGSAATWSTISVPPATTINNNADNRLITGSGTANTLEGESLLTFDGNKLLVASNSYNVLEMRADENNDGGNDDSIINFTHDGTLRAEIRYDESDSKLKFATSDNGGHVVIDSNGSIGVNISNPGSYDPNAESLVIGEIDGGDGNAGMTIVTGADKQGAIYFADGTGSGSYRGRVEYNHNTDTLGLGAGGSGYQYEFTSNRHFQAGNFCINPDVHNSSSTKYSQINSDNHANTLFGVNCHLGTNGSSGNHRIIQSNSHGSMGCAGILIGGNGSNNNTHIAFFAFGQGNSAGHDFGQDAWKMRIKRSGDVMEVKTTQNSGNAGMIVFRDGNNDYCGQITSNGASNTSNFVNNSDYRLKTNVSSITDGITRVKNLKPYQFEWKSDLGTKVDGFFAHEAQTVVPESVVGTKDEVDSDGKPKYQGIDQAKLVPVLTAALQEAIAEIEILKTKVSALEGS